MKTNNIKTSSNEKRQILKLIHSQESKNYFIKVCGNLFTLALLSQNNSKQLFFNMTQGFGEICFLNFFKVFLESQFIIFIEF